MTTPLTRTEGRALDKLTREISQRTAERNRAAAETAELRRLAAEILATFLPSGRVTAGQHRAWRQRAGIETT